MSRAAGGGSSRRLVLTAAGVVVCFALYTVLAILAHAHRYLDFDLTTTLALQHLRSAPTDAVLKVVSWFGYFPEFVPEFAAILLGFYLLRLRIEAIVLAVSEAGVGIQGFIVKPIVGRPRPSTSLVWVNDKLVQDPYSFTAGHVHTFMVIFGFIIYLAFRRMPAGLARTAIVVASAVFLVATGVSRVYLGDHWSSDVLGAYLAGGAWLGLAILAYEVLRGRGLIKEPRPRQERSAP
ncbi:MAG: phosphatase PAP2 family protein [Candidatus Dormibacteria bacterium]